MKTKFIYDIETTGLNPLSDRVLCISLRNVEHDLAVSFYGENEKRVLEQFANAIRSSEELIGFCNKQFDWLFVLQRCIVNNVKIKNIKQFDIREFVTQGNKFVKGTLRNWARELAFDINTLDGKNMKSMYEKKDWKAIKAHCEEDVNITHLLYTKVYRLILEDSI